MSDDLLPAPGGVAVWTARVVAELRARGHHVDLFGRWREGLEDGVGVRQRSFARWGHLGLAARSARALARADRVVATTWPVAPPGHRGWVIAHGSDITAPALRPGRQRRVLGRARVGAVSRYLAEQARALGATAEVLPAAVHIPATTPVPRRSLRTVVWAGRMVTGKAGDRFVRLVAALGVHGIMVGDGPLRSRWEALAGDLGASVRFTGWRPHASMEACWRRADLLLMVPRRVEGLGLVAVEAAACGVPVAALPAGGLAEVVGPGLRLDPRGTSADWAAQVTRWWTPSRGGEAWEHARRHHGVERTVEALLSPWPGAPTPAGKP